MYVHMYTYISNHPQSHFFLGFLLTHSHTHTHTHKQRRREAEDMASFDVVAIDPTVSILLYSQFLSLTHSFVRLFVRLFNLY